MNILGLIGFGYNPGAALVRDGRLVAHCEEERFTRYKGSHFLFPKKSMAWMLSEQGMTLDDIDEIAWAWDQDSYRLAMPLFFVGQFLRHGLGRGGGSGMASMGAHLLQQSPGLVRQRIREEVLTSGIAGRMPPVRFMPHHLCHAASAYHLSGFRDSNILVIDGSGEKYCTSLYHGEGGTIREIGHFAIPHSLGWFYAAITEYLGFIPYRDEGKVMGLAPYGRPDPAIVGKLQQVIAVGDRGYTVDPAYTLLGTHSHGHHFSDRLVDLLGPPRLYNAALSQQHKDIAHAAQHCLEAAAGAVLARLEAAAGRSNLCLAGGVTLNCKMNGVLREQVRGQGFFVQPSGNDAGAALGAALQRAHELGEPAAEPLRHTYYGPASSDAAIEQALQVARVPYRVVDDMPAQVAQALAANKIVGVFQGRAEFGARALGNRSILANPLQPQARAIVNQKVKFRESWRPFCPSLPEEDAARYIEDVAQAPFMTVAYRLKPEWHDRLASIVHVDGSIRPQLLREDDHPFFWRCARALKQLTGSPVILNTSFNVRGQPIVNSPEEAIGCFCSTGLDAMAIGRFWVEKGGA